MAMEYYKICPECSFFCSTREGKNYCPECGSKLLEFCPQCNTPIDFPYIRFCAHCGLRLRNNGENLTKIFNSGGEDKP